MLKINISAGESADLWFGFNVAGNVSVGVRTRDGSDTAHLWWIIWGLGQTQDLGQITGAKVLPIPIGLFHLSISAKLRAKVDSDAIIFVSESSELMAPTLMNVTFP